MRLRKTPALYLWVHVWMLAVCAENVYRTLPTSPSQCLRPDDCSPRETIPTEISRSHLLNSAVYHKPCLHIQLYALTPPLCSTTYNKQAEFLGCCNYSIKESSPLDPSSSVYVYLSFLHCLFFIPSMPQADQILGATQ